MSVIICFHVVIGFDSFLLEGCTFMGKTKFYFLFFSKIDYIDTWRAMEKLVNSKLVKSLGVSNFNEQQIDRLLINCRIKPVNNQVIFLNWIIPFDNCVGFRVFFACNCENILEIELHRVNAAIILFKSI